MTASWGDDVEARAYTHYGGFGLDATAAATSHGPIQRPQRHRRHAGRPRAISGDGIEVVAQGRVPPVTDRASVLAEVARTLQDAGIGVQDIGLRRPPSTRSSCT